MSEALVLCIYVLGVVVASVTVGAREPDHDLWPIGAIFAFLWPVWLLFGPPLAFFWIFARLGEKVSEWLS